MAVTSYSINLNFRFLYLYLKSCAHTFLHFFSVQYENTQMMRITYILMTRKKSIAEIYD